MPTVAKATHGLFVTHVCNTDWQPVLPQWQAELSEKFPLLRSLLRSARVTVTQWTVLARRPVTFAGLRWDEFLIRVLDYHPYPWETEEENESMSFSRRFTPRLRKI